MEQRLLGMNWASSREKYPKPDTILGVPHSLELPEKFPTPKTRTSLHLITAPDLLADNNSFNLIQTQTGCLYLSSITRAPPAHTSHTSMNFQSQQIFSIYRISLACCAGSCAALLEQHWKIPQEQPSSYPDLSFEDNKIFQPGNERAPLQCLLCLCFLCL